MASTKTPEEMVEEYCNTKQLSYVEQLVITKGFIAGYKAAKDQVADASKLIKPTDTVGKEELKCMIAHFENEDYKISVMVPGILPKDDGGELVCGVGLIVYDIRKKVV